MNKHNHSIKLEAAFRGAYTDGLLNNYGPRISRVIENTNAATLRAIAIGSAKPVSAWLGNRSSIPMKNFKIDSSTVLYETNFSVPREAWDRDEAGLFTEEARSLGGYMVDHWTKLVAEKILSGDLWYDGVAFYGAHPIGNTTQTTACTATQIPSANVGTATAPTADEASAVINEATMYMNYQLLNDANVAINASAKNFEIVCGTPALAGAFRSAVLRQNLSQGATSIVSGLNADGYNFKVVLDPALAASTDKVYMFITDQANKAFILHSERSPRFEISGLTDNDGLTFQTNNVQVGVSQNRGIVYGDHTKSIRITLS